jgi:hypothetical protein
LVVSLEQYCPFLLEAGKMQFVPSIHALRNMYITLCIPCCF